MPAAPDVARIRFSNAMRLFDEFVQASVKSPDAATLRGLERRFAERLHIQPSYWSQIKGGSRQIGERLARQFEVLCHKPQGWLDQVPGAESAAMATPPAAKGIPDQVGAAVLVPQAETQPSMPGDDDERFIVGLVLTYYRRHPQRARARLLDLLGEVLTPSPAPVAPPPGKALGNALDMYAKQALRPGAHMAAPGKHSGTQISEEQSLWVQSLAGTAPLKRKP